MKWWFHIYLCCLMWMWLIYCARICATFYMSCILLMCGHSRTWTCTCTCTLFSVHTCTVNSMLYRMRTSNNATLLPPCTWVWQSFRWMPVLHDASAWLVRVSVPAAKLCEHHSPARIHPFLLWPFVCMVTMLSFTAVAWCRMLVGAHDVHCICALSGQQHQYVMTKDIALTAAVPPCITSDWIIMLHWFNQSTEIWKKGPSPSGTFYPPWPFKSKISLLAVFNNFWNLHEFFPNILVC